MPIRRRVYRQGNSWVISIPEWALDHCHLPLGGYFELTLVSGCAIMLTPHLPAETAKPKEDKPSKEGGEPK